MSNPNLKKFIVIYQVPPAVMANWAKTDPETRKASEDKMRKEWDDWMSKHYHMIKLTEVGGKTKKLTSSGISDHKNEICLYSFIEAESHEAAVEPFKKHPHLQIPESSIEIMEVHPMSKKM